MKQVLVLFAHPAFHKSRVNAALVERVRSLEGVTFRDLYQEYPEMDIDVKAEQELLSAHEVIVFHHPLFWYSMPPILKEWQDLVLEHGWAYGKTGKALSQKLFLNVITTGGSQDAYAEGGFNNFTIRQFLAPIEQTANLCDMVFLPPLVVHGTHSIDQEVVFEYADHYKNAITLLRDGRIDQAAVSDVDYLNDVVIGHGGSNG